MGYRESDEKWRLEASCLGTDPEAFFPEKNEDYRYALKVCEHCDVRGKCLDYAIKHELDGIWGGTTLRQRLRIARMRLRKVA